MMLLLLFRSTVVESGDSSDLEIQGLLSNDVVDVVEIYRSGEWGQF